MAYNNNYGGNNKQWKELDKNTKSFTLRNGQAAFKSAMVLGHWNGNITFKIHPALPESQRSSERVFDWNTQVMSVLTPENTTLLLTIIREEVINNPSDFEPIGVSSGNSFIEISNVPALEGVEDKGIFINIYSKINQDGVPSSVISYKFNSKAYYKNFKTAGKEVETKYTAFPTEFMMFVTFLDESIKAMTNAMAHSVRNSDKYDNVKNSGQLARMAEKLGITSQDFNGGGSNYQGGSGGYFNGIGQNSQTPSTTENFDYSKEYQNVGGGDRMDLD